MGVLSLSFHVANNKVEVQSRHPFSGPDHLIRQSGCLRHEHHDAQGPSVLPCMIHSYHHHDDHDEDVKPHVFISSLHYNLCTKPSIFPISLDSVQY